MDPKGGDQMFAKERELEEAVPGRGLDEKPGGCPVGAHPEPPPGKHSDCERPEVLTRERGTQKCLRRRP